MTRDGVKSNLAKWKLIGGIQFKHVKNCVMFMQCNDYVYSDRTSDIVYTVRQECKLFVVCVVRKGAILKKI